LHTNILTFWIFKKKGSPQVTITFNQNANKIKNLEAVAGNPSANLAVQDDSTGIRKHRKSIEAEPTHAVQRLIEEIYLKTS
jgi:hypothetical protein